MEILFMNINLSKLQKYKIDKNDKHIIIKLFPVDVFIKIREYTLVRKEIIEAEISESLIKKYKYNFDYTYYLPSENGKYLALINFFYSIL